MAQKPSLAQALHVSVPERESEWAGRFLPQGSFTSSPLTPGLVEKYDPLRVLSVSSQDVVDPQLLRSLPGLEAVVTRSTGCDRLPLDALGEMGVRAYHLGGYASESVVEHALMFLLMLLRRVPEASWATSGRRGDPVWDRQGLQGRSLQDVTVGVLGTGKIGSGVVRLLCGLGVEVVGHDLVPDGRLERLEGFRYAGSLDSLLGVSEALTIHVPLTGETEGMMGARTLDLLPSGAVLVNTARGAIVNQEEVARRLRDGRLGGYAADVLPGEPTPSALGLLHGLPKVVLTPHLAAYDQRALSARYEVTARVVQGVLEGRFDGLVDHEAS